MRGGCGAGGVRAGEGEAEGRAPLKGGCSEEGAGLCSWVSRDGTRGNSVVWHPGGPAGTSQPLIQPPRLPDLETQQCPGPRLPVPLMHRAGAARCRWGQQPPGPGCGGSSPTHAHGALWGSGTQPARGTPCHIPGDGDAVTKPLGDAALQHEVGERHVAGVGGVGTPAGGWWWRGSPRGTPPVLGKVAKGKRDGSRVRRCSCRCGHRACHRAERAVGSG